MVLCIVYLCVGWLFWPGLKVLGPQEALVLTLFGKYIGTLKGEGFYFVNPFCVAVNPAAKTKLSQSGDVDGNATGAKVVAAFNHSGDSWIAEQALNLALGGRITLLNLSTAAH